MSINVDEPSPRPWYRRLWVAGVLLVLLVLAGTVVGMWWTGTRALERQIAALREAGEPVTLAGLDERSPMPEGPNGADLLERAGGKLIDPASIAIPDALEPLIEQERKRHEREQAEFDAVDIERPPQHLGDVLPLAGTGEIPADPTEPLSELTRRSIELYLDRNADGIDLVLEAAAKEAFVAPGLLTDGVDVIVDYAGLVRRTVGLMMLRAELAIEEGDVDRAVESFEAADAIISSLEHRPALIYVLVHASLVDLVHGHFERMFNRPMPWTTTHLDRLHRCVGEIASSRLLAEALRIERLWLLLKPEGDGDALSGVTPLRRLFGVHQRNTAAVMQYLTRMIEIVDKPWPQRQVELGMLREQVRGWGWPYRITEEMVSMYTSSAETVSRSEGIEVLLRTAVALERYYMVEGALPASLEQLAPDWIEMPPVDPFDGAPLRYLRKEGNYTIYSVGPGQEDGGGARDDKRLEGDIVFEVKRNRADGEAGED